MTENGSNMAEPDPSISGHDELGTQVIDIELLIAEVKKHPVLYSRAQAEYFEKDDRQKKWTEVCKALFQQWNKFCPRKKKEKVREVQNKWQKLKESFLKSYGGVRKLSPLVKKKRHQHLQSMSFLVQPAVAHDEDVPACVANNNNNEDDVVMDAPSNEKTQEDVNVMQMPSTSAKNIANFPKTHKNKNKPFVIPVPETEDPKYDPIDENMHFAFMLVPLLRKLNSEQRFYAWTNIIEVIKNAGEMGQKKICVLQNELRYPEPEVTNNLLQHNNINYTEPEQDVALDVPAFPPSLGRPTNAQGEIMYPETDTEDLDEI